MKKEVFVEAFNKMIQALEEVKKSLDIDNNDDFDNLDQYDLIDDIVFQLKSKLALLHGDNTRTDFFPDWQEENGEMEKNRFYHHVRIAKLDFITTNEVAKIMGWSEVDVLSRLEELPTPVYNSDLYKLWNRSDFKYPHLNATLSQVVTVSEAAELTGMSDRHIRRLCESKRIAARQTEDGTWLVGKKGLENYNKGMVD